MTYLAVVLNGPKAKNGRKVFDSFLEQNRQMFWNRELTSACSAITYMGFMRPGTLFISGAPAQLAVLKDAWARRILKPAMGYTITSLGDLGAIQQVEQMHFVPLGDVICDAVSQLNRNGYAATEQAIRQYVARHCPHVAPPGIEMVRQTITSLLATGFVYKMGEHHFVSVPTNSPVRPAGAKPTTTKNTVECQTGASMMVPKESSTSSDDNMHQGCSKKSTNRRSIFARLFSRGMKPQMMPSASPVVVGCQTTALKSFPLPSPPPGVLLPAKNKYPTYHNDLNEECQRKNGTPRCGQQTRKSRRQRRETQKMASSSSECLKYYPVDMPIEEPKPTRRRARLASPLRSSTPNGSDSAYSISPPHTEPHTDSNEEAGSMSDSEVNHTYINVNQFRVNYDSTQFEDLTAATSAEEPQILSTQMRGVLISNL
uniref:Stork_head domain-containing protein n=1 Tax=Caenorhabditis tropicalis TaxID=1561998 RepID=A0A1I7TQ25_9PELO